MSTKSPGRERRVSTRITPKLDYSLRRYVKGVRGAERSAVVRLAIEEFLERHPVENGAKP